MLTLSYTAGERLSLILADAGAPDDAAIRMVVDGDGFDLQFDTPRSGDTTFDHAAKVVLVIDKEVSDLLADTKLDVKVTGEESELVLIEPPEE